MAASKTYFSRSNYTFLPNNNELKNNIRQTTDTLMDFDESDIIWNNNNNNTTYSNSPIKHNNFSSPARRERTTTNTGNGPASLPVNVPDWSKILKEEYTRNNNNNNCNDDDEEDDEDEDGVDCYGKRIPPHEFLARQMARTRVVSFSVHEGVGRTLKGRDLSRLRNAIWEKTGFQD